ncbi:MULTISPECIES: hypothetical protein [unclassified Streptomyces]|uniref:hypothetical protein n=1 Tax=unclassified Streptomyces TaxID=2593676 RepID=UPI002E2DC26D|nr:hypothetical protein [Streptomyces sp. NBC_00223]
MISDPEEGDGLDGPGPGPGPGPGEPGVPATHGGAADAQVPYASDVVADSRAEPRPPRPWRWALGGAAVAAALCAGVLSLAPDGWRDSTPDLHGYRLEANPCGGTKVFVPLARAVKAQDTTSGVASIARGTVLDRARCVWSASVPGKDWSSTFTAVVGVELHRKTDPRAEFEDQRYWDAASLDRAERITPAKGVGDEAYLLVLPSGAQQLKVLHGGAVLTVTLSVTTIWSNPELADPDLILNGTPTPALTPLRPALIASARTVLAALRA